jgi:hypothetical protein
MMGVELFIRSLLVGLGFWGGALVVYWFYTQMRRPTEPLVSRQPMPPTPARNVNPAPTYPRAQPRRTK